MVSDVISNLNILDLFKKITIGLLSVQIHFLNYKEDVDKMSKEVDLLVY